MERETVRQSLFGAIVRAPIVEEIIFRFTPFLIYQKVGNLILLGLVSSIGYALIHWKFGRPFIAYTFFFGLFVWVIMVNYGLIFAILAHSLLNIIDWKIGTRRILTKGKYSL